MSYKRRIIDSFEEIEKEMEDLFDELLQGRPMWNSETKCLEPLAYFTETDNNIIVTIDLPFVKKENITLDVTPHVLKIEAKMQRHVIYDRWGTIQRTCRFRTFIKDVKLPSEVIPDLVKAKFKNGYLIVTLPKKVKPHKIEIE